MRKVIVVGLDGLDPGIVERLLEAGALPNLARLRAQGGYGRVATTTPAQTPVAWSTFATGVNPGGHGIFDFLRRDPSTYLPDAALSRYESRGAFLPPRAVNLRRGEPLWSVLSAAGIGSTVLRCPVTYPPDTLRGRMLSGMGVPDIRGGFGTPTVFTTDPTITPRESERVATLKPSADGTFAAALLGPRAAPGKADPSFEIQVVVEAEAQRVRLRSAGTPAEIVLEANAWSDWLAFKFKVGAFQTVRALVRFHLARVSPTLVLYASPVNFDPTAPMFPISHPGDYAGELASALGLFHTTGMVEDHTGITNDRFDEAAYLDQCDLAWREREAMMLYELERAEPGFFYCLFDTPDRVQHLFWRFREPDHPANREHGLPSGFEQVIEDQYRRSDEMVGKALAFADDDTLVIALSDHGFGSFRRGVNLNTLLHAHGLLALKDGLAPGHDAGDLLQKVDWERTQAYALGLGGIYLNLRGRERGGTLDANAAHSLRQQIAGWLVGLIDPATGATAVRNVRLREDVYKGPFVDQAPDLLVDFAPGYRASWSTALGGFGAEAIEDNVRRWSGDHIVDPAAVPGVLFMNRPFRSTGAGLIDLAPTILDALAVPRGPAMEGRSLFS